MIDLSTTLQLQRLMHVKAAHHCYKMGCYFADYIKKYKWHQRNYKIRKGNITETCKYLKKVEDKISLLEKLTLITTVPYHCFMFDCWPTFASPFSALLSYAHFVDQSKKMCFLFGRYSKKKKMVST